MHLPLWALVLTIYISFNCGAVTYYVIAQLAREPDWAPSRYEIETMALALVFPITFFVLLVVLLERLTRLPLITGSRKRQET